MTTPEEWKDIEGYEGRYQISNHGRILSVERRVPCSGGKTRPHHAQYMKAQYNSGTNGMIIRLTKNGNGYSHSIAALVLEAFVGPRAEHWWGVKYKDDNRENLHVSNLEWSRDAKRGVLTAAQVDEIRDLIHDGKMTQRAIGALFDVPQSTISAIRSGRTYKTTPLQGVKHGIANPKGTPLYTEFS